jgi:subtilisin
VVRQAGGTVKRVFRVVPAVAARMPAAAIAGLQRNPHVAYVEEDRLLQAVYVSGETVPWGVTRIHAPAVYATGNNGGGIPVAVLDSGIDSGHPDLAVNYVGGYDFVRDDAIPDDENGHGTHVSGTIAAADNGQGVVGIGPAIDLYSLKFLNASGSGYTSDEITAVEWAVDHGIKVLNMSFGSRVRSSAEESALNAAYAQGMLLVAAAGNSGNTQKLYPAAYGSVIAVAATTSTDQRASFSSYYADVEIAAPGQSILSTMPGYHVGLNDEGYAQDYAYLSGTSMATPHVAAVGALVFWQHPTWTAAQVRDQLNATASDLGAAGRDAQFGYGLVDAEAAVFGTPPPPPPTGVGTIQGTVYRNGTPVAGANVTIANQAGAIVGSAKTNAAGAYSIGNLPADANPGTYYIVSAKSKKYAASSGQVQLAPGEVVTQNLTLP